MKFQQLIQLAKTKTSTKQVYDCHIHCLFSQSNADWVWGKWPTRMWNMLWTAALCDIREQVYYVSFSLRSTFLN